MHEIVFTYEGNTSGCIYPKKNPKEEAPKHFSGCAGFGDGQGAKLIRI